ncbi:MAG: hypothetical protein ACTSRU_11070 [Candidatus Hodarchaeales archaeon]
MYDSSIQEDIHWVDKNYPILHQKYPGKYIVVKNAKVIVVAETHALAVTRAREILGTEVEFTVERIEEGGLFVYKVNPESKRNYK